MRYSQPGPAFLAEPRVWLVHSRTGGAGRRLRLRLGELADTLGQIALDLRPVAGAGIELLHDPRGPGAQPRRHLLEVVVRHLPHRPIEFELFDGAEGERLLLLESGTR